MAESPYPESDNPICGTDPAEPVRELKSRKNAARTVASLGLNTKAVMDGRPHFLLPPEHRGEFAARSYPLPTALDELFTLAAMPVRGTMRNGYATYVRRAKAEYKRRCALRNPGRLEAASLNADDVLQGIKETESKVKAEVASVREQIARAAATLTDLYGLIRTGDYMILKAFVDGTEVHGERITADTFNTTQGRILTHITRLGGIGEEDKKEAEGAVFQQAAESLRKRVHDSETVGLKVGPGDENTH